MKPPCEAATIGHCPLLYSDKLGRRPRHNHRVAAGGRGGGGCPSPQVRRARSAVQSDPPHPAHPRRYGEHVRLFKARAQVLMEQEDYEGMVYFTNVARWLCGDSDHELLCNQVRPSPLSSPPSGACTPAHRSAPEAPSARRPPSHTPRRGAVVSAGSGRAEARQEGRGVRPVQQGVRHLRRPGSEAGQPARSEQRVTLRGATLTCSDAYNDGVVEGTSRQLYRVSWGGGPLGVPAS